MAARVDALGGGASGVTIGLSKCNGMSSSYSCLLELLEDINKKIDKLLEPPPAKVIKALPKPDEYSSKKRGGRRLIITCTVDLLTLAIDYGSRRDSVSSVKPPKLQTE